MAIVWDADARHTSPTRPRSVARAEVPIMPIRPIAAALLLEAGVAVAGVLIWALL